MNHRTIVHHRCVGRLGTRKAVLHNFWVQREDWAVHAKLSVFSLDDDIPIVEPKLGTSFYWVNSLWRWARFWGSWTFCRRIGCHDLWLVRVSELSRSQDLLRLQKSTRRSSKYSEQVESFERLNQVWIWTRIGNVPTLITARDCLSGVEVVLPIDALYIQIDYHLL